MNNDYTNLTVNNMLFLILCNMGKTDSQICKILGVGPDSPRVMKYRLRKKNRNPLI